MASTWPCPAASRGSTSTTLPRAGHSNGPAPAALATRAAFVEATARPYLPWHRRPSVVLDGSECRAVLRWRRSSHRCAAQRSGTGAFGCRAQFTERRCMAPSPLRPSVQKPHTARPPGVNQRMPVAYLTEACRQACLRMGCVRAAPYCWNAFGTAWERLRNALGTAAQQTAAGTRTRSGAILLGSCARLPRPRGGDA